MAENGKIYIYTVLRIRGGKEAEKPEEMEFEECGLCGAKIPKKVCDEEGCKSNKLVHVCPKDSLNGEGVYTYFYYCDNCKGNWFMQLKILKKG